MKKIFTLILVLLIALCLSAPLLATADTADPAPVDAGQTTKTQETDPGGFLDWSILATYAGALAFVLAVTQFTKGLAAIDRLPTQVWSWIVAMVGMFPAYYFTGQLTLETAAMVPINALLVALAANGGYEALTRMFRTD